PRWSVLNVSFHTFTRRCARVRFARGLSNRDSRRSEFMIQVEKLSKHFPLPGGQNLVAVNELTFTVAPGEGYGLLGPNGAGKTTTLRLIPGPLTPTRGHAAIAGFGSNQFPDEVKRRVGYVSANAGLYQSLSVREMLLFFADLYGVPTHNAQSELASLTRLL